MSFSSSPSRGVRVLDVVIGSSLFSFLQSPRFGGFSLRLFIRTNFLFQAQNAAADSQASAELSERISCLEQEVAQHREDAGKAQSEVERLLEILRETENEKNDKEKKIHELER